MSNLVASGSSDDVDLRRFHLLIQSITDFGIYMLDLAGVIQTWNPGAQNVHGYAPAEIIGSHFSRFFPVEDQRAGLPQQILNSAREHDRHESDGWRLRKDGSRFWASVVVDVVRDEKGQLIGFVKITRDMTRRRLAEEALIESEQRFRLLVEGVIDYAIYMLDASGTIVNWNAGAQRMKGYQADEIIGHHFSRFYTKEDRATGVPARALERARREGRYEAEGWRVRKDGSRFWASVVIDAVRAETGELIGFAKITRDVTERRHAHEALRESERQFRLLVDGVTDYALYRVDLNGIVSSWNSGAQKLKGYTADEIIGQHYSRFFTDADRLAGAATRGLQIALQHGRYETEGWRVRKDGTLFRAHAVLKRIVDEKGVPIGFAKITRDVTEQRRTQQALEEAQSRLAYSQKMEAIGQLTGGVAHDFNNLLMIINGQTYAIKKVSADQPKALEALEAIQFAIKRGVSLTRQMLSFSRRQTLHPQVIETKRRIEALVAVLSGSVPPNIRLATDIPEEIWAVHVDPSELELAILNLVINARDAIPEAGTVSITAQNIQLDGSSAPNELRGEFVAVTIGDTGRGIPEDIIPRVFEPFFTTKGEGKGTGLGLSQVYGFVHQSGGTVTLRSELGSGTRVTLYMPRANEDASTAPSEQEAPRVTVAVAKRVLVVEDNPAVADVTALMLEELGYEARTVDCADAALEQLAGKDRFDLLLTDVVMPGAMDGAALARVVRQRYPNLPIVLATGYTKSEVTLQEKHVLRKPYDISELDAIIGKAVAEIKAMRDDPKLIRIEQARKLRASKVEKQ